MDDDVGQATNVADRLQQPVTVREINDILSLVHNIVLDVATYMVADWSTPEEDKKAAAIDEIMKRLGDVAKMQRTILPLPERDETK